MIEQNQRTTWDSVISFFLYSSQSSTKYVLTNRSRATTLGHWEEVWCMMKTLKRSKYLLKCFLLPRHTLSSGVAQVPWAFSDALNKGWCVGVLPWKVDGFIFLIFPGSLPEIVPTVILLPLFSTSIYFVTSVPEFSHRASKRRPH